MKKALVVGIDEYGNENNLAGCINDARAVAHVLKRHEDGALNYDVKLAENVSTRDKLTEHIQNLFKGDAESAIFFYSGHGYVDSYGKASLVTPDISSLTPGVSMDDILMWANESKINNKILILDCCFSGHMGNFSGDGTKTSLNDGVTILTASKADEVSVELDGHGLFTALLINALEGGASDLLGFITPGSIYSYIDKALGPWGQRPVFKSNVSTFDVIRKVTPPIDVSILRELPSIFETKEISLNPSYEETNTLSDEHVVVEPYSNEKNVNLFKKLQKLTNNGLVKPVGEDHMYYAAMNSKSCKLTPLGEYYLKLAKEDRF